MTGPFTRRAFLTSASCAGAIFAPGIIQARDISESYETSGLSDQRRNISSFKARRWTDHFKSLTHGAILVDIASRSLHFWAPDAKTYLLYPTSVPVSQDLTRLGRTKITRKVAGPGWSPTPAMRRRNPEWPDFVPPGPNNPLGTHALYLSWKYYRIHGTHDTRKIGRQSSNGCIGLYNEHIADLFARTVPGTQVLVM
ncbi:hypothetical protein BFP70_15265 [Thioclava sp. SK-1]|uniref:L,D-transpeptidase n=1 Tax=Thioclava sp. SK-1 TaxID=1889770 RepID=UPI000825FCC9|nr:L,D-transpeptidase [Thioclava sp. SK-1]OCX61665.1 hypothetical protein BFP70_15265 [Thioclava sp. SK-1]